MVHPEVKAFETMWPGGYYEGNPLDPHGRSTYSVFDVNQGYAEQLEIKRAKSIQTEELGFLSCLYVVYLICIKGRVRDKTILEIGPGHGAWSKVLMESGARELYALDALSAEHNTFFEYVDPDHKFKGRITYSQVSDFSCPLPEGVLVDFVFSFGCFCHIRRPATEEYFRSIYPKMKPGAEGFVMISDYEKMAKAYGTPFDPDNIVEGQTPEGVPWSHLGITWFAEMLEALGFTVLDPDIGCNLRDPVVHFRR